MKQALTCIFLLFFSSKAHAVEEDFGLTLFGSFVHTEQVPNALFFFSDIQKNDSFELRRALRTYNIDTIVLASSGGSVWEALNMAGIIFDKKMNTYVPKMPNEIGCYSACSYLFFAGQNRLVEGELGVHQVGSYDEGADAKKEAKGRTQQVTQFTTSEVIGFLNEFDTPPWVYERMFRSRDMYIFTDDEAKQLSQNTIDVGKIEEINKFIEDFLLATATPETEKKESETSFVFSRTNPKQVQTVQKLLNIAKCEAGLEDGIWGKKTASAVRRFAKTNKLTITSPELIDTNFVETLESLEYISCPPLPKPKPKKLSLVSKNWVLSLNCPNGQVSGQARLFYRKTTKSGDEYSISYTNNLGGIYYGFAYATSVSFRFNLSQQNGNSHSRGFGTFSNNRRTVKGRTEAGCVFVAASQ